MALVRSSSIDVFLFDDTSGFRYLRMEFYVSGLPGIYDCRFRRTCPDVLSGPGTKDSLNPPGPTTSSSREPWGLAGFGILGSPDLDEFGEFGDSRWGPDFANHRPMTGNLINALERCPAPVTKVTC